MYSFALCRTEQSALVIEQLLCAANKFCQYAAMDWRGMLCTLGEDCLLNLCHVWKIHSSQSHTIKVRYNLLLGEEEEGQKAG